MSATKEPQADAAQRFAARLDYIPSVNLALQQNDIPFVRSLAFANIGDTRTINEPARYQP